jgi:hypothetical protein
MLTGKSFLLPKSFCLACILLNSLVVVVYGIFKTMGIRKSPLANSKIGEIF